MGTCYDYVSGCLFGRKESDQRWGKKGEGRIQNAKLYKYIHNLRSRATTGEFSSRHILKAYSQRMQRKEGSHHFLLATDPAMQHRRRGKKNKKGIEEMGGFLVRFQASDSGGRRISFLFIFWTQKKIKKNKIKSEVRRRVEMTFVVVSLVIGGECTAAPVGRAGVALE